MKENQPTLRADLEETFRWIEEQLDRNGGEIPGWLAKEWSNEKTTFTRHSELSIGHGRIEERTAWALSDREINAYAGSGGTVGAPWPHLAQIVQIDRERTVKGKTSRERVYLVTSRLPERADAERLLSYNRKYWGIENRLHWVRDETFGEDRSQVRTGSAPQVLAGLRNLALAVLRRSGVTNIQAKLRTFAGRPRAAIEMVLHAHLAQ